MKSTVASVVLVLAGIAGVSFYAGRRTAPVRPSGGTHAEERSQSSREIMLPEDVQRRIRLQVAQAQVRPLEQMLSATGSVQANAARLAQIRALARGRIDSVYVRLGDRVEGGQPLLTYDNIDLGDAVGEYLAAVVELRKADAEAAVAMRALERARSLVDLGAVAEAEFLRRETDHGNALAAVEGRKAEVARIEEKLHRFGMTDAEIGKLNPGAGLEYHRERSQTTLRAPFAGVITQISAAAGETIGTDSVLMTLGDLSTVWVLADIYEKDLSLVRPGRDAGVEVTSYPGRTFTGTISHVGDVLDSATRTAKARVEVRNPDNLLKVEMFAIVRIPVPTFRSALAIPAGAIQNIDGEIVAFVKTSGERFEPRVLVLGERGGDWIEVLRGLREGETVVTEGSFLLKSEMKKETLGHHEE